MTQELTTTGILALFETDKLQRMSFVSDLMSRIENGDVDPLKIHVQFKCIEDIINKMTSTDEKTNRDGVEIAKKFKGLLLEKAQAYGEKKFSFMNSSIEIKEVGTKYDFSKCEDQELNALLAQKAELDAKLKARQDMLKTVSPKGMIVTDPESGETYTIYPPSKSSTTSIAVSLK